MGENNRYFGVHEPLVFSSVVYIENLRIRLWYLRSILFCGVTSHRFPKSRTVREHAVSSEEFGLVGVVLSRILRKTQSGGSQVLVQSLSCPTGQRGLVGRRSQIPVLQHAPLFPRNSTAMNYPCWHPRRTEQRMFNIDESERQLHLQN
jgi:hypothetical protein